MRLIIQSVVTGRFLAPSARGEPEWVLSLRDAAGGVFSDPEDAIQLVADHLEYDDKCQIVDLDRLGIYND
jgi:hypothetical protein